MSCSTALRRVGISIIVGSSFWKGCISRCHWPDKTIIQEADSPTLQLRRSCEPNPSVLYFRRWHRMPWSQRFSWDHHWRTLLDDEELYDLSWYRLTIKIQWLYQPFKIKLSYAMQFIQKPVSALDKVQSRDREKYINTIQWLMKYWNV